MRLAAIVLTTLALSGCERIAHNMYDQPRFTPMRPTPLFDNGSSARPAVPDTVAHSQGRIAGTSSARAGGDEARRHDAAGDAQAMPYPVTRALLDRGRQRFDIYCAPCHGPGGDGDGLVARRGFPRPPSYHDDRLRAAPDRHFFDVMTEGHGVMYSYAERVVPEDRWAIVAYIRALQLSQNATLADVPPETAAQLHGTKP
jgi:mono/diheme cytochrome c family protein